MVFSNKVHSALVLNLKKRIGKIDVAAVFPELQLKQLQHLLSCLCNFGLPLPVPNFKVQFICFWSLVLCFKSVVYTDRARENFRLLRNQFLHTGHIQSAFHQLLLTLTLCLKSVK